MNFADLLREIAELIAVIGGVVAFVRFVKNHTQSLWLTWTVYVFMGGGGISILAGDLLNTYSPADTYYEFSVLLIVGGSIAFLFGVVLLLILIVTR